MPGRRVRRSRPRRPGAGARSGAGNLGRTKETGLKTYTWDGEVWRDQHGKPHPEGMAPPSN